MLLALPFSARAQQMKNIARIGYLASGTSTTESARSRGIQQALRERGLVEGQNVITEYRYAKGNFASGNAFALELVRSKVDIILVAGGEVWIRAAKDATNRVPIVMIGIGSDPVEEGLVDSLARPGGNVTGITNLTRELGGKRLELLKEAVPTIVRVAILYTPSNPGTVRELKEDLPEAARTLKLTLEPWELRSTDDLERVFAAMSKTRPDGLCVLSGPKMGAIRKRLANLALKVRLPSTHPNGDFADAGGLMYYGADLRDSYRRVAYFVDRILKGAKPADLPVEQPMRFELVVNLKTAKQIGVTIDPNLLARATRLIR